MTVTTDTNFTYVCPSDVTSVLERKRKTLTTTQDPFSEDKDKTNFDGLSSQVTGGADRKSEKPTVSVLILRPFP